MQLSNVGVSLYHIYNIDMNKFNLQVNDIIQITYNSGYTKSILVTSITKKSWYSNNGRNSFGTLDRLMNLKGEVIKCEIIKK